MGMSRQLHALIVFAHPVPGSFTEAIRDRVRDGFLGRSWTIDDLDLHAAGFDPCLDAAELAGLGRVDPVIDDHVARLRRADALVFVHPTWWGAQPAIVKGWLDRVLAHPESAAALCDVRRLVVVSSHGSSRLRNAAQGVPGRRITFRLLRSRCHRLAQGVWIPFYSNDTATDADRKAFLERVEREIADLALHGITSVPRLRRARSRS